jgi:hypothetical protein
MALRLFGWTRAGRHEVTSCVTDLVLRVGGFVLDAQRFSNKALVLKLQLPSVRYTQFISGLTECSVNLDGDPPAAHESVVSGEISGSLHVRFIHDEPDLRIETPAVPG